LAQQEEREPLLLEKGNLSKKLTFDIILNGETLSIFYGERQSKYVCSYHLLFDSQKELASAIRQEENKRHKDCKEQNNIVFITDKIAQPQNPEESFLPTVSGSVLGRGTN
jgi:hypothetical protein